MIGKSCYRRGNSNILEVVINNNCYIFECFRSLQTHAVRGRTQSMK